MNKAMAPIKEAASIPFLPSWAKDFAKKWNSSAFKTFILHGNVSDLFPTKASGPDSYCGLEEFLQARLFPDRGIFMSFNLGEGLLFASQSMKRVFSEWLSDFNAVEGAGLTISSLPKDFASLAPILRRFLSACPSLGVKGVSLLVEYAEKIFPQIPPGADERSALVSMLKMAASNASSGCDLCILLVTESPAELTRDLLRCPQILQLRIDLPNIHERTAFLNSGTIKTLASSKPQTEWSEVPSDILARHLSGLSLVKISQIVAEAAGSGFKLTLPDIADIKRRMIEDYCGGLVRFKQPKPGLSLDSVATHAQAKRKLRDVAKLFAKGASDAIERGILLPGRIGVGKSFIVECFASECGIPVMELGEFRSKWVGDTEAQLSKILLTVKALGPIAVVVDEADAVLGDRSGSGGDNGLSGRVFSTLAAHIGDSSLRGREIWIAMTSRPDLLAIDMRRQGRFGLSIPLFPAQGPEDVSELFKTLAKVKGITFDAGLADSIKGLLGDRPLTGSDVDSILSRALESAELDDRSKAAVSKDDIKAAIESFIDPLDPALLELQELAAVLACSDRRFLPMKYIDADRSELRVRFEFLKRLSSKC